MPGYYEVEDRTISSGWGWISRPLPAVPLRGRLVMNRTRGLIPYAMSEPDWGRRSEDNMAGAITEGVSDCSVVAILEKTETGFDRYFFQHVAGSHITQEIIGYARIGLEDAAASALWALAVNYSGGAAFSNSGGADMLFDMFGVPRSQRSYYVSHNSGHAFALRYDTGEFGEPI